MTITASPYQISALLTFICTLLLAIFVLVKAGSRPVARLFGIYTVAISAWSFCWFYMISSNTYLASLFWARFLHYPASFIPATFLHFVQHLTQTYKERNHRVVRWFFYLAGALFAGISFSHKFVASTVPKQGFRYFLEPGPLYISFFIFFAAAIILIHLLLFTAYKKSQAAQRVQLGYALVAYTIGYAGGTTVFLPVYDFPMPSFALYAIPLCHMMIAYTILAYRLMDIEFALSKTVQLLLLGVVIFLVHLGLSGIMGGSWMSIGSSAISAGFLALLLFGTPLRNKIRHFVEQALLQDRYAYQAAMREMAQGLVTILELDRLVGFLGETLVESLGAQPGGIWLENRDEGCFALIWSSAKPPIQAATLEADHPLIQKLQKERQAILCEKSVQSAFASICAEVVVPLLVRKNHLLGFIGLGQKTRGAYGTGDLEALEVLAAQAAIAIENAQLYTLAITEERTRLYTPQHFRHRFEQELYRCRREKKALILGLLELPFDYACGEVAAATRTTQDKPVNFDNLRLSRLGDAVKKSVRASDIPAFLEDGSVAILFPQTGRAEADPRHAIVNELVLLAIIIKNVLDRIRRNIADTLGATVAAGATAYQEKDPTTSGLPTHTTKGQVSLDQLLAEAREGVRLSRDHGADGVYFPDTSKLAEVFKHPPPLQLEEDHLWTVGDITLHPSTRKLFVNQEEVPITTKEFDLLRTLVQREGRILTRQFLTEAVWGQAYMGISRNVDMHMFKLREKLKTSKTVKIETVKGAGYRLLVSEPPSDHSLNTP